MTKEQFKESFIEAVTLSGGNMNVAAFNLAGCIYDLRLEIESLKTNALQVARRHSQHLDEIDLIASENEWLVNCRSCGKAYQPDYNISEFSQEGNYCGGSERCLP